jgi:AraC-like DNA-binding protein
MERARILFMHSKASLPEIALEVGFNNNPAFSKQFRSEFGQSPTQFRAQKQSVQVSSPAI